MDLTVREHIAALQARINALVSKLVNEKGWAKRNAIESEIRAVRMALAHYLAALDLESTLRGGGINILRADTVGRSRGFAMRRFHAMTFSAN